MVASCSQDRLVGLGQDTPIQFRAVMDRQTKATALSTGMTDFNVTAWKGGDDHASVQPHIDQADYERGTDGTYVSANKYFWPHTGSLEFYAYAPKATAANGLVRNSELSYTVTPFDNTDNQIDLVFAKNSGTKDQNAAGVTLNFRHTMSQVRIKVKNTNPSLVFNVTDWMIAGVDGSATFVFDDAVANTNTHAANSQYTLDRDMWSDNDSRDKNYTKDFTARNVTSTNSTWGQLPGSAILIPQERAAATAYEGSNAPQNPLNGAYVAIRYEAHDASDGEEMAAAGTWGCWPVKFDWQPGFSYNYTIDLSEFGYKPAGTDEPEPVMNQATVRFVDVEVDRWQPENGNEIDLSILYGQSEPYLRFHTVGGTNTLYLVQEASQSGDVLTHLEYSLDEGTTWTGMLFRSGNSVDGYENGIEFGTLGTGSADLLVRGKGFFNYIAGSSVYEYKHFVFSDDAQLVSCSGRVGGLYDYDNPNANLIKEGQYERLFENCKCLLTAPELSAMVLTPYCYKGMFKGCVNLKAAPLLPATSLSGSDMCYAEMFSGCTQLTSVPASLPATKLAKSCYFLMFTECSALTVAPELPATSLSPDCYSHMFSSCTSLVTAPALPATVMSSNCYSAMFAWCSNLENAPVLGALSLETGCYSEMFYECRSLNKVKALFTENAALGCGSYWLYNVSATGKFIKNQAAQWSEDGIVPSGWEVESVTE